MDKEMIIEDVKSHIGRTNLETYTNCLGRFVVEVDWTSDTSDLWFFRDLYKNPRNGAKITYFGANKYRATIIFEAV